MNADRSLHALLRCAGEIARAGTPAESAAAALAAAAAALAAPRGWVQRCDDEGVPRVVHSRGVPPACGDAAESGWPWAAGAPPAPGVAVVVAGGGARETLPGALRAEGVHAVALVPVVAGGRTLGALALLCETPREWSADEARVLEFLAQLLAAAFERDRDRAARERLERDLLRAQRLESVGRLARVVAHDFNNMLTAMIGYLDLVGSGLPPDAEEQAYVARALEAAEQASALSQQMLAFARRQPGSPAPVDVNAVLGRTAPLLQRLLPGSLRFEALPRAESAWVMADAGQVEQAIVNLALRARDAVPEGGALVLSTVGVEAAAGGDAHAGIEAVNTGESLHGDDLRRALDPYASAEAGAGAPGLSAIAALVRALWPVTAAPGA